MIHVINWYWNFRREGYRNWRQENENWIKMGENRVQCLEFGFLKEQEFLEQLNTYRIAVRCKYVYVSTDLKLLTGYANFSSFWKFLSSMIWFTVNPDAMHHSVVYTTLLWVRKRVSKGKTKDRSQTFEFRTQNLRHILPYKQFPGRQISFLLWLLS
jgi:hypothetical protein